MPGGGVVLERRGRKGGRELALTSTMVGKMNSSRDALEVLVVGKIADTLGLSWSCKMMMVP